MLAKAEREEEAKAELRKMRRALYEKLLNKFDELSELALECWKDRPCISENAPSNDSEKTFEKGVHSFEEVLNSVMLEGSPEVIKAAHDAKVVFRKEMQTIAGISLRNAGNSISLAGIDHDEYVKCHERRMKSKYAIVNAAAVMLQHGERYEVGSSS